MSAYFQEMELFKQQVLLVNRHLGKPFSPAIFHPFAVRFDRDGDVFLYMDGEKVWSESGFVKGREQEVREKFAPFLLEAMRAAF